MGYSILQKMARGASAMGAQGYLEKFKTEMLAIRDTNLQSFQTSEREAGQTFQAGEKELDRTAQTVRDIATEDYRAQLLEGQQTDRAATADYREKGLINQAAQLELSKTTIGAQVELTKIKTEMATIELDNAKDRQKAYKMLRGIADPKMQKDIMRWLNQTSAKKAGVIIKRKVDEFGAEINEFYVFDKDTGDRLDDMLSFDNEDPLGIRGK